MNKVKYGDMCVNDDNKININRNNKNNKNHNHIIIGDTHYYDNNKQQELIKEIEDKYRINTIDIIATDGNYSYNKVINTNRYDINRDCNKHIIDKQETCLVESYNASLRGRFARFVRRTKAFSRSFNNMKDAVYLWVHRDVLIKNRRKYCKYFGKNN